MRHSGFNKEIVFATLFLLQCLTSYSQNTISEMRSALERATAPRAQADICFDISLQYANLLKIDSALFFAEKTREHSIGSDYEIGIGKFGLARARALNLRNKRKEAAEVIIDALQIFSKHKSYQLLGMAYLQRAMSFIYLDPVNSKKCYWQAIQSYTQAGDSAGVQRAYFETGRFYTTHDVTDSAAIYLTNALALGEKLKNKALIFNASGALGSLYQSMEDMDKAAHYFELALNNPSASKIIIRGYQVEFAQCLINKGDLGRIDSLFKEIEILNNLFKDEIGKSNLEELKGLYQLRQKNYQQAMVHLRYAYNRRFGSKSFDENIMHTGYTLALAEFGVGDFDSVIARMQEVIAYAVKGKNPSTEMAACELMSRAFEKKRNADSALYYFRAHIFIKDSLMALQRQKAIIDVSTRYETEKKEQAIELLRQDARANSLELQLRSQQLKEQELEADKRTQQLELVSQQNEINKLDASQKALQLENEVQKYEKSVAQLNLMAGEAAFQKLLTSKQSQQKKIVYTSIAILLALTGYVLYRYVRKKKLQNQQEVLRERLRISRELHDEVGSTLSGIAMYSHLTREQIKAAKTQEVEKSLNNIQQSAGEMVTKLGDIVWLVNPEKDSMHNLIERLEQYAEQMAMIKDMNVKISVSPRLANINLPVDTRRNIYLFCKEAINNAVKYSDASILELTINENENRRIEISISDNGKGFDSMHVKKGNGLANMKLRAREIGGEYILRSMPQQGTRISLTLKFT